MSPSGWLLRAKDRINLRRFSEMPSPGRWIGVDLANQESSQHIRKLLPLLILALVAALSIAALRIDLIRIRYAMASVVQKETRLLEEQRNLIVRRRQLRDPVELAVQARARGFRPATHVVVLTEPTGWQPSLDRVDLAQGIEALRSVAAGPPDDRSRGHWQ